MAIVNRDNDVSQQEQAFSEAIGNMATGATFGLLIVPYPSSLVAIQESAAAISGSPSHSLWLQRFIVGTGVTSIQIGASLGISAFATSGCQGFSILPAAASFQFVAGDVLLVNTTASNASTTASVFTVCLKALQDIKTYFGTN